MLKMDSAPFLHLLAEVRLPAQSSVDRDARSRPPRVLRVEADVLLIDRNDRGTAVLERRHASEQKVGKACAGDLTADRPVAARPRVRLPAYFQYAMSAPIESCARL
jgi:hypothetical protein